MLPHHPMALAAILDHVAHVERLARAAEREGLPQRARRLRAMIGLSQANLARRMAPVRAAELVADAVRRA